MLELWSLPVWLDRVIPLTVELYWVEIDSREFIVGNLATFLIPIRIELGVNF